MHAGSVSRVCVHDARCGSFSRACFYLERCSVSECSAAYFKYNLATSQSPVSVCVCVGVPAKGSQPGPPVDGFDRSLFDFPLTSAQVQSKIKISSLCASCWILLGHVGRTIKSTWSPNAMTFAWAWHGTQFSFLSRRLVACEGSGVAIDNDGQRHRCHRHNGKANRRCQCKHFQKANELKHWEQNWNSSPIVATR